MSRQTASAGPKEHQALQAAHRAEQQGRRGQVPRYHSDHRKQFKSQTNALIVFACMPPPRLAFQTALSNRSAPAEGPTATVSQHQCIRGVEFSFCFSLSESRSSSSAAIAASSLPLTLCTVYMPPTPCNEVACCTTVTDVMSTAAVYGATAVCYGTMRCERRAPFYLVPICIVLFV